MSNNNQVFFSIAIPAFKQTYLKECIDSIISQSFKDFELIIVNDASPEDLDSVVNLYNDSKIRYYKNEVNFGAENVVDNWNKCLSLAKGKYFVLMGDDDVLEPNYFEVFFNLIKENPTLDVYHCRAYIINEHSEKVSVVPSWPEYESVYENMWHRMTSKRLQYISDFVYRTSHLNEMKGFHKFPLAWASDDVTAYIAAGKKGIAHTNTPLFNYRRSSLTISSSGNVDLKMDAIDQMNNWFLQYLKSSFAKNLVEEIFYRNVNQELSKFILKKKIRTISDTFQESNILFKLLENLNKRKLYGLKFVHVCFALFEFIKKKKGEKIK